jgi:hypothetical protein
MNENTQRRNGAWKTALTVVIAIVLIVGAAVFFSGRWIYHQLQTLSGSTVTVSDSTVVQHIQQLQRLETVVYAMDQVVTEERSTALPAMLAGDRILLIVHGEVVAGVDLSKLRPQDVSVHGKQVRIKLPAAEIFSTRMDNQRTRVYSRETGLLSTADPQLESEARRRAERQLTAAALQEGILNNASQNAKNTVTALLRSLGFEEVNVE